MRRGTGPERLGRRAPRESPSRSWSSFCDALRGLGVPVRNGVFGACMAVELVNDGPVTIVLDVEGEL